MNRLGLSENSRAYRVDAAKGRNATHCEFGANRGHRMSRIPGISCGIIGFVDVEVVAAAAGDAAVKSTNDEDVATADPSQTI